MKCIFIFFLKNSIDLSNNIYVMLVEILNHAYWFISFFKANIPGQGNITEANTILTTALSLF